MTENAKIFDQIVKERRSVRIYNSDIEVDHEALKRSVKRAILAPNSSNMQLWEFYWPRDEKTKKQIVEFCFKQPTARTAKEFLIIVARPDKWEKHAKANVDFVTSQTIERENILAGGPEDYYKNVIPRLYKPGIPVLSDLMKKLFISFKGSKGPFYREVTRNHVKQIVHKSCALAAQTYMLSMKAEGYDTCPMEGFDSLRIKKLLGLPKQAMVNMIISAGVSVPEGIYGERFRVPEKEVFFEFTSLK